MKFHKDLQWMTHIQNSSLLILNLERSEIFHALKGPTFNIGATQRRLDTNVTSANAFLCIRTESIRYTLCRYKPYLGECRNMKVGTKEMRKGRKKDSWNNWDTFENGCTDVKQVHIRLNSGVSLKLSLFFFITLEFNIAEVLRANGIRPRNIAQRVLYSYKWDTKHCVPNNWTGVLSLIAWKRNWKCLR